MGQINETMTAIDQVTQRNASSAEELAATAEQMRSQADWLQQLVAFFRAGARASAPRRPLAPAGADAGAPALPVPRPAAPANGHAAANGVANGKAAGAGRAIGELGPANGRAPVNGHTADPSGFTRF